MNLCYDCKNFHHSNLVGDNMDLKCKIYKTYVLTPTKANRCKHFKRKIQCVEEKTK